MHTPTLARPRRVRVIGPRPPSWAAWLRPILAALAVLWSFMGGSPSAAQTAAQPGPSTIPAARQAGNVAIITIKEAIDQTTYRSVHRRIELAKRAGADAIVFEIDSPGGDLYAVLGICNDIKGCPIKNTVAWVNHNAYSGGAIIALACREIVVSDPATLGDAAPIRPMIDPKTGLPVAIPETERQKILSPLISELVDSARRNHYDELLVQGIAARGVELWRIQNTTTGQQLFITRSEYRTVFGEEPAAGTPTLAAAPSLSPEAKPITATPAASGADQKPEAEAKDPGAIPQKQPSQRPGRHGRRNSPRSSQPLPPGEPDRFIPASPGLAAVARDAATQEQEIPSARPVLTSADRGQWELKEYVSSGDGLLVLKADQLKNYGLATSTIANDEELKAFFGAKHLLRLEPTWSEGLVAFLTLMPVRGVLIVVFLLALFIEMTHPGLVLPGAISALALIALLAPPMLINLASWWDIAAIVVGVLLIALEIFVIPGFGIAGILGLVLLFGGLIGTFIPPGGFFPDTPAQRSDMLYGAVTMVLALATSGVLMYFAAKHFGSIPVLNRLVLRDATFDESDGRDEMLAAMGDTSGPVRKGMTGTALTPLRPAGRVELSGDGGRIVDVVSDLGYIAAGQRVRITSVSDFRIAVEPLDEPGPGGAASGGPAA